MRASAPSLVRPILAIPIGRRLDVVLVGAALTGQCIDASALRAVTVCRPNHLEGVHQISRST